MRFQKSQPAGAATLVPHSSSTGPLKNMDASTPARKAHARSGVNDKQPSACAFGNTSLNGNGFRVNGNLFVIDMLVW